MLKKKLFLTERALQEKFSCLSSPLLSKTLNIYAKAINSSLCTSRCGARPFPSVNLPCRVLNLEGFCWQRGYRNPYASSSYKKSYQKFLEALHLCVLMRKKGGEIYVLFDGPELRPPSTFLDPQRLLKKTFKRGLKSNALHHELSPAPLVNRAMLREPRVMSDLKCKPYMAKKKSNTTPKNPFYFFPNLLKNKAKYETVYSWSGEKWVGGTFSNFKQVSKNINLYKTLSRQFLEILEKQASPRYFVIAKKFHGNLCSKLCKKSTNTFLHKEGSKEPRPQELTIESLKKKNLPDLIIIENAERYRNVIVEAESLKIPVIAFVESDIVSNISIALPLNALKHYFLAFLLHIIYKI